MNIGQNIRLLRKKLGISQKQLGLGLGVSQDVISKIETGKRHINLNKELPLIFKILRCSANDIFQ